MATKDKDIFIEQARQMWGDKYDYSNICYKNGRSPIVIYCPKHDYHFRVALAQNHILKANGTFSPTACPICKYEEMHGKECGKDWANFLKLSKNINRVGLIKRTRDLSKDEERQRRKKEETKEKREAYIKKFGARNMGEARFLDRLQEKYGNRYDTSLVEYKDRETPVTLICKEHGAFMVSPKTLLSGQSGRNPHGCPICDNVRQCPKPINTLSFFSEVGKIYGEKLVFHRVEIKSREDCVVATCSKHGERRHTVRYWLSGKGCEYCNGVPYMKDWVKDAQAIHGDKYKYIGKEPQNTMDYIHYICPKHGEIKQKYTVHISLKCGCPYCANYSRFPLEYRKERFLEKARNKYGNRFTYNMDEYVNNDTPMSITCNIHHHTFKATPDTHIRKSGSCPMCAMSSGELEIYTWLKRHNIDFTHLYKIGNENKNLDLSYLEVDFYLPSKKVFIEFNGEQHYKDVLFFRKVKKHSLEKQQLRDQTLREYCTKYNIRLIEIRYDQQKEIDKILTEIL